MDIITQLCQEMKAHSDYIAHWMNYNPNEDSVTDWLIHDLSSKLPKLISYTRFTRKQEVTTTGADWEWVFIYKNATYKLRIQAKKFDPKDNLNVLKYKNRHGLQIDKLIADANSTSAIPLYFFYTPGVSSTLCQRNILNEGVYICSAEYLNNNYLTKPFTPPLSKKDITDQSIPLSCLFCCPVSLDHGSGIINIKSVLINYLIDDKVLKEIELTSIPNYINYILTNKNNELPDWYEDEFKSETEGLDGVIIFNFRN